MSRQLRIFHASSPNSLLTVFVPDIHRRLPQLTPSAFGLAHDASTGAESMADGVGESARAVLGAFLDPIAIEW
jgi:hypothetical protein